jgi:hypothetical protein
MLGFAALTANLLSDFGAVLCEVFARWGGECC